MIETDTKVPSLLETVDLEKSYGGLRAVDGLSFHVDEGEVLGISGPNGAGKTTLFDLISGISSNSGGRILYLGEDISDLNARQICHRGIARTFQLNAGFDGLTIEQNVFIGANFGSSGKSIQHDLVSSPQIADIVDEALAFVGLQDRKGVMIGTASVLERKLSMIASALATEPRLMIMDEPVGGLVPEEIERMKSLVQAITDRNITIILVEHVMRFLTELSNRVLIMHHGKKLFEGTPDEMYRDQDVIDVYLGSSILPVRTPEPAHG